MTSNVSTSRGRPFRIDTIVRRAYQLAGLLEVNQGEGSPEWLAKAELGRDLLDAIVDELQAEGLAARPIIFRNIVMQTGVFEYSIADDILDIIGDGMYIDPSNDDVEKAQGETLVKQIDREAWQRLSNKGAEGRPTLFLALRNADFVVRVWPVPSASDNDGQVRFQMHQFYADTAEGDKDADLRPFWNRYLFYALAHDLATANTLPVDHRSALNKRAEELKTKARMYANQRPSSYAHIQHPTGWQKGSRR